MKNAMTKNQALAVATNAPEITMTDPDLEYDHKPITLARMKDEIDQFGRGSLVIQLLDGTVSVDLKGRIHFEFSQQLAGM